GWPARTRGVRAGSSCGHVTGWTGESVRQLHPQTTSSSDNCILSPTHSRGRRWSSVVASGPDLVRGPRSMTAGPRRDHQRRAPVEGPEIKFAEAVIDNGPFGTRTVRFETGRIAKQASGSAVAYLDEDTMVLSTTTAGKHPKDHFDFFPLTVDVEERQYAAGKIPGSFFRREGRPSSEAILACRLIDRPLRPLFVKGLRNEVQVVETVLAIHPDDAYDVLAMNGASMSTQISGLPFSGPVGATRIALVD